MNPVAAPAPLASHKPPLPATPPGRVESIDALRGFDMFWIVGATALVRALERMGEGGVTGFLSNQLRHVQWEGFTFYDLIFPLFLFLVGASLVFSLERLVQKEGRRAALNRIFRRSILLFALGVFYNGGLSTPIDDIRWTGVLGRIAICYFFAGVLFCYLRPRALIGVCAGLLIGYWAVLSWVPIRDVRLEAVSLQETIGAADLESARAHYFATTERVRGQYDQGYNVANHFDFRFLPGRGHDTYWDPEGYLSTLPAIATCLLGVFAGLLIRRADMDPRMKVKWLVGAGFLALLFGFLWGLQFPVVKKIWTSSYVLVAGGYSALFLALFYQVIDVWGYRAWSRPFVWIGMNAITIYLFTRLFDFRRLSERFVGGDVRDFFNTYITAGFGDLIVASVALGFVFLLAWFLHKNRIFLRV